MRYGGLWGGHQTCAWALIDGGGEASCTFNQAGGLPSAFVNGRCRICMVVGPRCRSTRLVGCHLHLSTGAAGYVWWWGGHSTWVLVDSGGVVSLTFNQAGGLSSAFVDGCCRIRVVVGQP